MSEKSTINKISKIFLLFYVLIPFSIQIILSLLTLNLWGEIYGTYLFFLSIYMLWNKERFQIHFLYHYVQIISALVVFGFLLFVVLLIGFMIVFGLDDLFNGTIIDFLRPYFR